jgi:predicted secreted Zn-dependent protease
MLGVFQGWGVALLAACLSAWTSLPALAQNSVRWTTNYYAVTGATLGEIRQSIRASRPWKQRQDVDGMTDWRVAWRFSVTPTPGGCRCATFTTQTTIAITMPRWSGPTNAPESTRQMWQRYVDALGQHEAGHGAIALTAAADLQKRIKEIGDAPDCDNLKARINALGQQVMEEHRRRDREYDERTRHGATQGAVLSGRRGRRESPKE